MCDSVCLLYLLITHLFTSRKESCEDDGELQADLAPVHTLAADPYPSYIL